MSHRGGEGICLLLCHRGGALPLGVSQGRGGA